MAIVPTCGVLVDAWKANGLGMYPRMGRIVLDSDLVYQVPGTTDRVRAFVKANPGLPSNEIGRALSPWIRAKNPVAAVSSTISQLMNQRELEVDEYGGRWIAGTCPNPVRERNGFYTCDQRRRRWKREIPKSPTAELVALHRAKTEWHAAKRAIREVRRSGIGSSAAETLPTS